jgi:PKD repeat protein
MNLTLRKLLVLAPLCTGIVILHAQPVVIVKKDTPKAGDTLRYTISSSSINVNKTGRDTTWDFSKLAITNQEIAHYYAPNQSPYILNFFLNSTYGIEEKGLGNIGGGLGITVDKPYSFYKVHDDGLFATGRGATVQNLPLGIVYSPFDTLWHFPLTFGSDTSRSQYAGAANLPTLGSLNISGKRMTVVDGWGSIITPFGQFNCIRVKSVVNETDSIALTGSLNFVVPNNRTEYRWLAPDQPYPILEVIVPVGSPGQQTSVHFRDHYRPEAYLNTANFTANKLSTQVQDTVQFIDMSFGKPTAYHWSIAPSTFTFTGGTTANSAAPKCLFSAEGKYTVTLKINYEGGSDDTTMVDMLNILSSSSVAEMDQSTFSIFPVPAKEKIVLRSTRAMEPASFQLGDLAGRMLATPAVSWNSAHTEAEIDTHDLQPGIYMLSVLLNGSTVQRKVVIE